MKRIVVAIATAGLVAALSTSIAIAGNAGGGPKATGAVTFTQGNPYTLEFNAQIGPDGLAKGRVFSDTLNPIFDFAGSVDCYVQVGNQAWLSGLKDVPDAFPVFLIGVEDNGEGDAALLPDQIRVRVNTVAAGESCLNMVPDPNVSITTGNIQIHDEIAP
jgi:hypothetical protein